MIIIGLVEEDIFAVLYSLIIGCELLENTRGTDAVFFAELFPKLGSD